MHKNEIKSVGGVRTQDADVFTNVMQAIYPMHLEEPEKYKPLRLCGILYMDCKVDLAKLKEAVLERLVTKIFRFRAVPRCRNDWAVFEEVPVEELDMAYHFEDTGLSFAKNDEWSAKLNDWNTTLLDQDKPFWKFKLVDQLPCGRPAVVFLCDHCLGDGVSLTNALKKLLCDGFKGIPISAGAKAKNPPLSLADRLYSFWVGKLNPFLEAVLPADVDSSVKLGPGEIVQKWHYESSETPLKLEKFKEIKNKVPRASMNDVMMTVVALGFKKHFTRNKETIMSSRNDLSASFVIDTRPAEADRASDRWFGNEIVTCGVVFPLHRLPIDTLVRFRNQTRAFKESSNVPCRVFIRDHLLSKLPRKDIVQSATDLSLKFSVGVSNVFMSHEKLFLTGVGIDDVHFCTFVSYGAYVGIVTYNGKVNFNVLTADDCELRPRDILDHFPSCLDELHKDASKLTAATLAAAEDRAAFRIGWGVPLGLAACALSLCGFAYREQLVVELESALQTVKQLIK